MHPIRRFVSNLGQKIVPNRVLADLHYTSVSAPTPSTDVLVCAFASRALFSLHHDLRLSVIQVLSISPDFERQQELQYHERESTRDDAPFDCP